MTTLEKAARALAASWYLDEAAVDTEWRSGYEHVDDYVNSTWDEWLPQARAVLMAVREPDGATCVAGMVAMSVDDLQPTTDEAFLGFTAMIDAILAETPDQG